MTGYADIAIVGGGLSALSSGLALARAGYEVVVLDPRPQDRPDFWGLVLWPAGTRTLEELGTMTDVLSRGTEVRAIRLCSPAGTDWVNLDLEGLDAGTFVGILPSRLDDVLRTHAEKAGVRMTAGAGRVSVRREGDGWRLGYGPEQDQQLAVSLLLAADGPASPTRDAIGLTATRWRPKDQVIITGVGGPVPVPEARQTLGPGWSAGYAGVGDRTWLYAVTRVGTTDNAVDRVRSMQLNEPALEQACGELENVTEVRPWRIRAPRWATDRAMLIGDAAHGMLPYFGLGGTLSLGDVPVLVRVVDEAFKHGDMSADRLAGFRRNRIRRVAYAQRISSLFGATLTWQPSGFARGRERQLRYIARNGPLMHRYFRDIAVSGIPRLSTRVRLGIP